MFYPHYPLYTSYEMHFFLIENMHHLCQKVKFRKTEKLCGGHFHRDTTEEPWGIDQNNNSKDGTYDKKRVREFQSHWRDERPWLDYNDDTKTMFCSFCQSFPITADRSNSLTRGTTNLRIEPIKVHESTPEHFSCHRSVSVVCTLLSGDSLAVVIKR